jgi:hypothetical protein
MTFLDKTFCRSPSCINACGRKMTEEEMSHLKTLENTRVSYAYFCEEPIMKAPFTAPSMTLLYESKPD